MLVDRELHTLFSKEQIGNAINTVYSNCCSDLPFLYTTECDEERRVKGIQNLVNLYGNFFERYSTGQVVSIGNDQTDGRIGFICYDASTVDELWTTVKSFKIRSVPK